MSNIARYVYNHPDFLEYNQLPEADKKQLSRRTNFIKNVYDNAGQPHANQRYILDEKYGPTDIFFSDNDLYVIVIGKKELIIVDARTGSRMFKLGLPKSYKQLLGVSGNLEGLHEMIAEKFNARDEREGMQ